MIILHHYVIILEDQQQQVKINKKLVKIKIKLTFPGHAEVSMVSAGFSINRGYFHHGLPT